MRTYIALLHEEDDGSFRVSFPDLPQIVTAGDDLEDAMEEAEAALEFAAEESLRTDGSSSLNPPRTADQLRADPAFLAAMKDAVVIEVELPAHGATE